MRQRSQRRRQRATLRTLERHLRRTDPELARLLSGGSRRGRVPSPRFTSVPTSGYAVVGGVLLLIGLFLGVGSAVFWGVVSVAAATLRHRTARPAAPSPGSGRSARDRRESF